MLSRLEISIHLQPAASGKISVWEITRERVRRRERERERPAETWSSECFLVVVAVLCSWLSLVLYNVS